MAGIGPQRVHDVGGQQGGAGGGGELPGDVEPPYRCVGPFEQRHDGRGRAPAAPRGRWCTRARAGRRPCEDATSVDPEDLEGGGHAHDVDDGVETADLVEVHVVDGHPVERRLDLGQGRERGQGPFRDPGGQACAGDDGGDLGVGPGRPVLLGAHHGTGPGDAASEHALDVERPPAHREPPEQPPHLADVGSCVDERSEGHVPGDAGEAVEPRHPLAGHERSVTSGVTGGVTHGGPARRGCGRRRRQPRSRCQSPPR